MAHQRMVVASLSLAVLRAAEEAGVNRERLSRAVGLSPEQLSGAAPRIPLRQHRALVREAVLESGDPALCLKMGLKVQGPTTDLVGHVAMHAPDLRAVFDYYSRYWRLMSDGIRVGAQPLADGGALVTVRDPEPVDGASQCDYELALVGLLNIARQATDTNLRPQRADFSYEAPAYAAAYHDIFGCPLNFARPLTLMEFSRVQLQLPTLAPSAYLRDALESHLLELSRNHRAGREVVRRVREIVLQDMSPRLPTLAQVARILATSQRSLQRQLSRAGTTFSQVVEEAVRDSVLWSLQRTELTSEEVAFRHGYASLSAFVRAVRRWTGQTPSAYRRQR